MVGNDAYIGTSSATALALIIHEQATNAVKYGALSNQAGRVRIKGNQSDGGAYTITWHESGGPRWRARQSTKASERSWLPRARLSSLGASLITSGRQTA